MTGIRRRVATRSLMGLAIGAALAALVVVPTVAASAAPLGTGGLARLPHAAASVTHAAPQTATTSAGFSDNVLSFGANPDGITDSTGAFRAAVAAVESNGGGTVDVPAGTYAFSALLHGGPSLSIKPPATGTGTYPPVTLQGAGEGTTTLVEHVGGQPLLQITRDGTTLNGLTFDARTYGGGADVTIIANNTTIDNDSLLGAYKIGKIGGGSHSPFALYFKGPPTATQANPVYNSGNTVENTSIYDAINNDGFSFSFQNGGTISNITHFGSRVSLFVDENTNVTNYTYTPNPLCLGATNGFYITGPASNMNITGFTTFGNGGVIDGPTATQKVSGVTINNETFKSPSPSTGTPFHLDVGDANGVTIENSNFNTGGELLVTPNHADSPSITVQNSTIPLVNVARYQGSTFPSLTMDFTGDTFPSDLLPTFSSIVNKPPGPATITIDGGTWSNLKGGFDNGATNLTYAVTNLAPIPVSKPVITGNPVVGSQLTASNGTWLAGQTPAPTFTYQWENGGSPISGANSSTFTPSASGTYSVVVTATNPTGSTPSTSAGVTVT